MTLFPLCFRSNFKCSVPIVLCHEFLVVTRNDFHAKKPETEKFSVSTLTKLYECVRPKLLLLTEKLFPRRLTLNDFKQQLVHKKCTPKKR